MDCPVLVDSAMGEGMATGRLQDLADADKYTLMQGHDKKQIKSVIVGATGLTLNLENNIFGVSTGTATIAFFWEDVRVIHCYKVETVSDHPGEVYYCDVLASSLKKPFTVQCAGAENLEHLVSAMEFYVRNAKGGQGAPIGGIPYPSQGVRLDGDGKAVMIWDNSPIDKSGFIFGDRIWGVDADAEAHPNPEKLEAALQSLAPGKHRLYVVTPKAWENAAHAEDTQSNTTPIPERREHTLQVP